MKRRDFLKSSILLTLMPDVDSINKKVEQDIADLKRFNHIKVLSLEEGFWFRTDNNVKEDTIHIPMGNPHTIEKRFSDKKIKDFLHRTAKTNYSNYVFHIYDKWNRIRSLFACEKTIPSSSYYFKYYPWDEQPNYESVRISNNLSLEDKVITEANNFKMPDLSDVFSNILYIGEYSFVNDF